MKSNMRYLSAPTAILCSFTHRRNLNKNLEATLVCRKFPYGYTDVKFSPMPFTT